MVRNILVLVALCVIYLITENFLLVYIFGVFYNIANYVTDPDEYETDNITVIIGSLFSFLVPIFNLFRHE